MGCRGASVYKLVAGISGVWFPTPGRRRSVAGQELWDVQSCYMYMEDLLELNRRVPSDVVTLPEGVNTIATPLCWEAWARDLQRSPGQGVCGVHSRWHPARFPYRF